MVFSVPALEQLGQAVEVNQVFLHPAQEVNAPWLDSAGRLLVVFHRRVHVRIDQVQKGAEQPL
ncbi:MAG: hypothetical protein ACREQ5_25625, partial [Candidatus Dormibacteria bacterium]